MSAPPPYHRSPYLAKKRAAIDSELRGEAQPETKNAARDQGGRTRTAIPPCEGPGRGARVRKRLDLMAMLYGKRR